MLKPGVHLLIVDFDNNEKVIADKVHNGFDQGNLIALMTRIGFKETKSKPLIRAVKFMNQDATLFINGC